MTSWTSIGQRAAQSLLIRSFEKWSRLSPGRNLMVRRIDLRQTYKNAAFVRQDLPRNVASQRLLGVTVARKQAIGVGA